MLYSNVKNIVTEEKFMAWLENKSGHYSYLDNRNCALAQYLKDQFPFAEIQVGGATFYINDEYYDIPENIKVALFMASTFESLLVNLKERIYMNV